MDNPKLETVKPDQYYGLRLISYVCKALTSLITIIGIGLIGANTIRILNISPRPVNGEILRIWINESLTILLIAAFFGFLFFIISQIIDVQMAINVKLNAITNVVQSIDDVADALKRPDSSKPEDTKKHQEIMDTLQRQHRMIVRLYKDTVGDPDGVDDSNPIKLT